MIHPSSLARDRCIHAAIMAAQFARELGLPPGNLWEPPITRLIEKELFQRPLTPYAEVENAWRFQLGL